MPESKQNMEALKACFPLEVLAQGRRSEIFRELTSFAQQIIHQNDPTLLRIAVFKFVTQSRHKTIQHYKKAYMEKS